MTAAANDAEFLAAASALACQRRLISFCEEFWPIVESQPFVRNWHHDLICEHLEAVTRGDIQKLLINIPPGMTKSLLVSVIWPCWEWANDPSVRWFFASYDQRLSTRDSVKCRTLIKSAKFQSYYGNRFRFVDDQNQKVYFETNHGGYRLAASIGGHGTGEHMDRIVVDDPHDVEGAASESQRQTTIDWWDQTMATRGVVRDVRRVIIMQRLHESDLSGHVLKEGVWVHICLPMRHEPNRMNVTPLGATDQRSQEGELLFPSLFTEEKVQAMEKQLGLYGTAGQLQQRPAPLGGGMFKRSFFEVVPAAPAAARRVRFWDKASTEKGGAYTVGLLMSEKDGIYYIEDVVREQLEPFARNRLIKQVAQQDAAKHRYGVTIVIEQEPGSGGKESSLISIRELAGYHVLLDKVQVGKQERALAFASQCGAGNVKIVAPTGTPWLQGLLDEFEQFPNGKYKDQVDAATGAFNKLALGGGMMQDIDLFGADDESPLTAEEMEDVPEILRDIIEGVWHDGDDDCVRARWIPYPRAPWN